MMTESEWSILKKLQEKLIEPRFFHTIGVADTAANLAACYSENLEWAYLAGLLHDYAKNLDAKEILKECQRVKLPISPTEYRKPGALLHAKLGAYYARTEFGIREESILSAIEFHTSGRPNMTMLEKIVFIADYMEPGRKQKTKPELNEIRKVAFCNIDLAVYYALDNTLFYLASMGEEIDTVSFDTFNYYKVK